jgi:hypothetical protein
MLGGGESAVAVLFSSNSARKHLFDVSLLACRQAQRLRKRADLVRRREHFRKVDLYLFQCLPDPRVLLDNGITQSEEVRLRRRRTFVR